MSDKQNLAPASPSNNSASQPRQIARALANSTIFIFAIILPFITLGVELYSSMSAQSYIDPIPTLLHLLLVISVPIINLTVWFAIRHNWFNYASLLIALAYFSIAVSLVYALAFLPITPIALFLIPYFGLGLLPLSALLALISAGILLQRLKKRLRQKTITTSSYNWLGAIAALAILVVLEVPGILTNYGLNQYQSGDLATRRAAVNFLRNWGNEQVLLHSCYNRSPRLFDAGNFLFQGRMHRNSTTLARNAFYEVTGHAFNERPAPDIQPLLGFLRSPVRRFNRRDADQGNQAVGGRLKTLWLHSSNLDGSIDAKASLAYLEWTFEYKNYNTVLAEARKEIRLPPGAVVSRVSLWVNGVEKEATVATKQKAVNAYRSVVAARKDPILVTSTGRDRVLVQMYPVPANGGTMKAKIGISVPLLPDTESSGILYVPKLVSHNFSINQDFKHSLWLESKHSSSLRQVNTPTAFAKRPETSTYRQQLNHDAWQARALRFAVTSLNPAALVYASDTLHKKPNTIIQRKVITTEKVKHIILIIDGSASMQTLVPEVIAAIEHIPTATDQTTKIEIILAGDSPVTLFKAGSFNASDKASIKHTLSAHRFGGGTNNIAALEKALYKNTADSTAIVWIHGPQPYLLQSPNTLIQYFNRKQSGTTIYDIEAKPGANKLLSALPATIPLITIPFRSDLKNEIQQLLLVLTGKKPRVKLERQRLQGSFNTNNAHSTSDHLIRLWANEQIYRLLRANTTQSRKQAMLLASQYRLVTPLSGAIVLETAQQYQRFKLRQPNTPVSGQISVPTIPEPETWALIILTLISLGCLVILRRRQQL